MFGSGSTDCNIPLSMGIPGHLFRRLSGRRTAHKRRICPNWFTGNRPVCSHGNDLRGYDEPAVGKGWFLIDGWIYRVLLWNVAHPCEMFHRRTRYISTCELKETNALMTAGLSYSLWKVDSRGECFGKKDMMSDGYYISQMKKNVLKYKL